MTSRTRRAFVVFDLGFGDAGKGLVVDALVRLTGATLVLRYNGGAQAGHNVVTADGRHHTFAQLGAGTFVPGVRTLLGPEVVVHPTGLWRELAALAERGVDDALARLSISDRALVVTPWQQALGRLRELARGAGRHGSCGVGIGETVATALDRPELALRAGHLRDRPGLTARLRVLRRELATVAADLPLALDAGDPRATAIAAELACFAPGRRGDELLDDWADAAHALAAAGVLVDERAMTDQLGAAATVVAEGAQGVLLDQDRGFHPHTTWSRCSSAGAEELLAALAPDTRIHRVGLLRSHVVRHGPGPLPTEDPTLGGIVVEHNTAGPWQGPVRYGWFDGVLARYALAVAGPVDLLVITHLDLLARLGTPVGAGPGAGVGARLGTWLSADAYRLASGELLRDLPPSSPPPDLTRQERLTELLASVTPVLDPLAADRELVLARIAHLAGRRVDCTVAGPTAADVAWGSAFARLAATD
jgi:adenylosuccinate synthase